MPLLRQRPGLDLRGCHFAILVGGSGIITHSSESGKMSTWGPSSEKKKQRKQAAYVFNQNDQNWTKSTNSIDQSSTKTPSSTNTLVNDNGRFGYETLVRAKRDAVA